MIKLWYSVKCPLKCSYAEAAQSVLFLVYLFHFFYPEDWNRRIYWNIGSYVANSTVMFPAVDCNVSIYSFWNIIFEILRNIFVKRS
jgi:hypothetical protein